MAAESTTTPAVADVTTTTTSAPEAGAQSSTADTVDGQQPEIDWKSKFEAAVKTRDAAKARLRQLEGQASEHEAERRKALEDQGRWKELHDEVSQKYQAAVPALERVKTLEKMLKSHLDTILEQHPEEVRAQFEGLPLEQQFWGARLLGNPNATNAPGPPVPTSAPQVPRAKVDPMSIADPAQRRAVLGSMTREELDALIEKGIRGL